MKRRFSVSKTLDHVFEASQQLRALTGTSTPILGVVLEGVAFDVVCRELRSQLIQPSSGPDVHSFTYMGVLVTKGAYARIT